MNLQEYLLATIKQLNELTTMALSVDLSGDQLHEILNLKTEAILKITEATNLLSKYMQKK